MTNSDLHAAHAAFIEHDIESVREQLKASAFSGHELLIKQSRHIENLPLARLLCIAASLGAYDSKLLQPVGAGLELLRLAAEIHYTGPSKQARRNLDLVTADYYYAAAIELASTTARGYVVARMVGAIAAVAKARSESNSSGPNAFTSPFSSLFNAAIQLGMHLGECQSGSQDALQEVAGVCGELYYVQFHQANGEGKALRSRAQELKERARAAAGLLPGRYGDLLDDLLATLVSV